MGHPGVMAAAVVGVPHVRLGEQVAALVQQRIATGPQEGAQPKESALHCIAKTCICDSKCLCSYLQRCI